MKLKGQTATKFVKALNTEPRYKRIVVSRQEWNDTKLGDTLETTEHGATIVISKVISEPPMLSVAFYPLIK